MGLFTDDVQDAAQQAADQNNDQTNDNNVNHYMPAESLEQLYEKLLLPRNNYDEPHINDYMAGGFLNEDELDVVRSHSIALKSIHTLERMIGNKLRGSRDLILNTMLTILHISKSRDGAGYQTLITQKSKSVQRVESDNQQEKSWFGGQQDTPSLGLGVPDSGQVSIKDRQGRNNNGGF